MSKYDFDLDLSENSSTGLILSKIKQGSAVLEFGCANGRMTRYMKEELGCRVYIVEYDRPAYEEAVNYAVDGLCDDILSFQWTEKFSDQTFDAILFADVLEHLAAPEQVLTKAAEFLTETGSIYISIPNITHNDILLKAVEERFDYTKVGLLDDTHVHFWGLKNIAELAKKCGLTVRKLEGTACPTGCTEQFAAEPFTGDALLYNILRERTCGEIYQFVITLDRSDAQTASHEIPVPFIESHIYVDTGEDFNESEKIDLRAYCSGNRSYLVRHVIKSAGMVKRVRLDPVEGQDCILRQVSIRQGDVMLCPVYNNGIELNDGVLLQGEDPFLYANALQQNEPIVLEAEVLLTGGRYLEILKDAVIGENAGYSQLRADIELQTAHNAALRSEMEVLQRDLEAYIILANNKDKWALELQQELEKYRRFPLVRLGAYAVRVTKKICRTAKRILKRCFRA